jgi:uracil-DNA glycosylase family 4
MSKLPIDPHELLRRALAGQIDLGLGEIVMERRTASTEAPIPEVETAEEASRTVSVEEAIGHTEVRMPALQNAMDLMTAATYETLDTHNKAICNCQLCPLGQTRRKFVYGVGNPHAKLLFIGEAPGEDEDRIGEPFVGRAGQLLDRILAAIQLSRQEVYIANILKCRPPGNRDPQPDEVSKCILYLKEQIRIIKPKLICALGRIAAQNLLATTTPLGKLRGKWHEFEGIPLLVTYHPAALLRFPEYKKETWADMQVLKARYDNLT